MLQFPGESALQDGGSKMAAPHHQGAYGRRTPLDLTVVPGDAAAMSGARERVVCCPTHQGLLDHEETYLVIRDFLLAGREGEE